MRPSMRLVPRSLHGQMLLAVALALLVAQVLAAVLIFRAEQGRREAEVINSLAFQLVSDPRLDFRPQGARGQERADRRQLRIERILRSPQAAGEHRDPEREAALRTVLEEQGVAVGELVVLGRDVNRDSFTLRDIDNQPRIGPRRWQRGGQMVLAGLQREGESEWLVARTPRPSRTGAPLRGVLLQTLILYVVLVGGLALLLRRITRPLAALTRRVERFGGSTGDAPPLELSGPDDTRRLIAAHNAMEARIAALLDEKDVMLGAIGHDLKTPLAALRVRIESVEDAAERARMAATIEDITRSLDDILSLARVGRPSDPLEKTDLTALVAAVVEEYEDMGEPVTFEVGEKIALPLRATWLRRALRNLVGNALRYGNGAHITLAREGDHAAIRIADTGPGIAPDRLAEMLEPFVRGEASRNRETGGAGLGLTLARAIAEQHGGTLSLANRHAADGSVAGLLVELRLPVAR